MSYVLKNVARIVDHMVCRKRHEEQASVHLIAAENNTVRYHFIASKVIGITHMRTSFAACIMPYSANTWSLNTATSFTAPDWTSMWANCIRCSRSTHLENNSISVTCSACGPTAPAQTNLTINLPRTRLGRVLHTFGVQCGLLRMGLVVAMKKAFYRLELLIYWVRLRMWNMPQNFDEATDGSIGEKRRSVWGVRTKL